AGGAPREHAGRPRLGGRSKNEKQRPPPRRSTHHRGAEFTAAPRKRWECRWRRVNVGRSQLRRRDHAWTRLKGRTSAREESTHSAPQRRPGGCTPEVESGRRDGHDHPVSGVDLAEPWRRVAVPLQARSGAASVRKAQLEPPLPGHGPGRGSYGLRRDQGAYPPGRVVAAQPCPWAQATITQLAPAS